MSGFDLIIKRDEDYVSTVNEAAQVLVDGTIGGHTYRFLLDTGAARSEVIFDEYTSAFDRVDTSSSSGVFAAQQQDLIRVPSIQLGPISKTDFTLVRKQASDPDRNSRIGMDLLKDYRCHFLFDEKRVEVDQESEPGLRFQELLLDSTFHPYVDMSISGFTPISFRALTTRALWDTGSRITIADMNFVQRYPALFEISQGTDATGTSQQTPMFMMASTRIGNQKFPPWGVAGMDLSHVNSTTEIPMDLKLGYSTLQLANWLFDFPQKRWAISKRLILQIFPPSWAFIKQVIETYQEVRRKRYFDT